LNGENFLTIAAIKKYTEDQKQGGCFCITGGSGEIRTRDQQIKRYGICNGNEKMNSLLKPSKIQYQAQDPVNMGLQ